MNRKVSSISLLRLGKNIWKANLTSTEALNLAERKDIKSVYPAGKGFEPHNDRSRELLNVNPFHQEPNKLTGDGFTAAVWDFGWAGLHEDLNQSGKLVKGDKGASCDDYCYVEDHPTHVSGTLLGAGNRQFDNRGVAPDADLVTYVWPGYNSTELFSETNQAINTYDAVVSQNSWGLIVDSSSEYLFGDYRWRSGLYDSIIANESSEVKGSIPIVFSAGNDGDVDFSSRYNTTTGPGGTAKNTITVGALNDNKNSAYYSSWGPTDDGRIKPTVVADGGEYTTGYIDSTIPSNSTSYNYPYDGMQGTSMAAPAVSGVIVLINQQFNRTYGASPAPATVKASLIHNANDLDNEGPDYSTGWGLVNASRTLRYINNSDKRDLIKREKLLDTGDLDNFTVIVPKGESVNFTLAWSDAPGTSSSGKALINDLDLVVRNDNGDRKYPWTLSWENRTDPALQTQEDHKNPVEQVTVSSTSTRKYSVVVNATKLPEPDQSYSLLMSSNSAPVPELSISSPLNTSYGELPDFNVSVNDAVEHVNYSVNDKNYTLNQKNSTFYYNNSVDVEGEKTVTFYAENLDGYTVSETVSFTVDTTPPSLEVYEPVESANVSGNFSLNASWSDETTSVDSQGYELYNSSYSQSGSLNATVNSSSLKDGEYNISFNVSDSLNNYNSTLRTITVDNTRPVFDFLGINDGEIKLSGPLSIDAGWSDETSGVDKSSFTLKNQTKSYSGTLNGTVYEADLSNSVYNLTYNIEDYAANNYSETVEVLYDTKAPSLKVFKPGNNSLASANFSVKAGFADEVSGIKRANYSIANDSTVLSGKLNDTTDTSNLSEDEYSIDLTVYDNAGRMNYTTLNVTLDDTPPTLNLSTPEDGDVISGNFSVNATYSDDVGIEKVTYELSNGSIQDSGELNATLNSSNFADGNYNLTVEVEDTAGNINSTRPVIEFDNTPPEVQGSTIAKEANVSGTVDVNFTFLESNTVTTSEFRLVNSTGNVTSWEQLNYTGLNTSNFSEGSYNLSLQLNDSLGNFRESNFTEITIDNTAPEISLKEYNLTRERNGWVKDNKTVEASCGDTGTGVSEVSSPSNSSESYPVNFTLAESGKNDYMFSCLDYAGNTDSKTLSFSIDSTKPELQTLSPEEDSTTARTVEITGEFFNESTESGINVSNSSINVDSGSLSLEWSNSSFTASISELEYSESFTLEGTIVDIVGHKDSFTAGYTVEEEPEDSSGGGGGGGGGGFTPSNDEEEDEEDNETTTDNTTEGSPDEDSNETFSGDNQSDSNQTDDSEDTCQVSAVNGSTCRLVDSCAVPVGWEKVESCSSWEKNHAEELIQQLPEDGEEVSEARSQFESGNYSQAIAAARSALEQREKTEPDKTVAGYLRDYIEVLLAAVTGIAVIAILVYRKRRKEKLLAEVEEYSEELVEELNEEGGMTQKQKKEFVEASKDLENEDYWDAREKLEDISNQ